jgi:carbonic anhydrase
LKTTLEKPENGLAGLKHWRQDVLAGLIVAIISAPFSIGIAVASGAPPITGLTSAIVAGVILPIFGGSYVTISGPAAGLAPALYGAMLTLGGGNLAVGYPLLLPVIMLAGVIQLILSRLGMSRFVSMFPTPVVEGMLAAIGLMIMVKQLPALLGKTLNAHSFFEILTTLPQALLHPNMTILGLGLSAMTLLIVFKALAKHVRLLHLLSPQLLVVLITTCYATTLLHLEGSFLIHIPNNPLAHGITWPNFSGFIQNQSLWIHGMTIALALTLIDGLESLATIRAIDKIDPYQRTSNPDKTLLAIGVSNICSSLVGGLTIIPGGVKSTANIMAGGRTQWANFYNACFLLAFLLFFHTQLNLLPLTVLAAILIVTGYQLCRPQIWQATFRTGPEQLLVFVVTVLLTLSVDLMWGILGGVTFAFIVNLFMIFSATQAQRDLPTPASITTLATNMLKSPVILHEAVASSYHIYLARPLVCFNYPALLSLLQAVPAECPLICLHFTESVLFVDPTVIENLSHWAMAYSSSSTNRRVEWMGLDQFRHAPLSAPSIEEASQPIKLNY